MFFVRECVLLRAVPLTSVLTACVALWQTTQRGGELMWSLQQLSENHSTPNHKVNVNLSPRKPRKPARPRLPVKSLNVCRL